METKEKVYTTVDVMEMHRSLDIEAIDAAFLEACTWCDGGSFCEEATAILRGLAQLVCHPKSGLWIFPEQEHDPELVFQVIFWRSVQRRLNN